MICQPCNPSIVRCFPDVSVLLESRCERGKKRRQTEEEVGRQHQRKDRPGVRQVPEGSGEQKKNGGK